MSNKRYYWLKLDENFFEDDTIEWIEEQEGGEKYVLFYLKLCLKSLKEDGNLIRYVGEKLMPYDIKALAKLTNTDKDTVAVALKAFEEIGLAERKDTGEIFMKQIDEMIGTETASAKRVRKHRAKQKMLQSNTDVTNSNSDVIKSNTEIEIDKDIDIDKEIDTEEDEKDLFMYDEKLKKVVNLLENNIGMIPPILIESISEYSDVFEIDMWSEAIKIAANNKIRTVNYVLGILKQWKDNNVLTVSDLEALRKEKEAEREKKQKPSYSKPNHKTRFHNFEQRTDNYTADDLNKKVEEKARKKREEYLKNLKKGD